jgi:hypothetical protein
MGRGLFPISVEHHRALRYSFVASVELWELDSEKHLSAHIKNLNLLGCFVETPTPFPEGTKVRLSVTRGSMNFVAIGRVKELYDRVGGILSF